MGLSLGTQQGAQESHLSSGTGTGTHPDHQGEHHGAGDNFGHREVAIVCVDDKCVIRVSWRIWVELESGPSVVGSRCCGGKPSLTRRNTVDDTLVNGLVSIHGVDGTRTQDEGGWL